MKIIPVKIPSNLRYISEWKGYQIPLGKCIIDKKVCGCGYTQFCLENSDNIILCSPRLTLLENKLKQNLQCYYFRPIFLKKREKIKLGLITDRDVADYSLKIQKQEVYSYLEKCRQVGRSCKFLVTYDSLPKLLEILVYLQVDLGYYKTIVDEFQLIFSDSKFKADVELDFIGYLNLYCKNICFLSSTPMLEEYLELMPEFQGLDYYEFNWDEHQIILPNITRIKSDNLEQSIIEIIGLYKEGKGPTKIVDGVEYQSKEAVFYVSNVSMITSVIKKTKLLPSEVNIICSNNEDNLRKIKKCGKGFNFGESPLKGEPHKMFTFCTSTAFCGVDFYSTNAKSYVFSNCNLDTMSIDISIELPQIIGRQRLETNVFRYDVGFYYQTSIQEFTREDFDNKIKEKNKITYDRIKNFELLSKIGGNIDDQRDLIRSKIELYQYSDDFCGIDRITGLPIYNNLVYLSELRAWELQNKIYNTDLSVLRVLDKVGSISNTIGFLDEIVSIPYFDERMKRIVEYIKDHPEDLSKLPEKYLKYLSEISPKDLVDGSFRKDNLDKKLKSRRNNISKVSEDIIKTVYTMFNEGEVYTRKEIKNLLSSVYGIEVTSKAVDINLYFETTRAQITNKITRIKEDGFRLIKRRY